MTTAHEINKQLNELVDRYAEAKAEEYHDLGARIFRHQLEDKGLSEEEAFKMAEEGVKESAITEALRKHSTWSGGHSVTNMLEQIDNRVAADFARPDFLSGGLKLDDLKKRVAQFKHDNAK